MSDSSPPSFLSPTAAEFCPGQTAHPSPAPSEPCSSPLTPSHEVLNAQPQYQLHPQPQPYCGQQSFYGYQPYPLFDGYTQSYESHPPPPNYYAPPPGPVWTPPQNGYVGYAVEHQEAFAGQFSRVQDARAGNILYQPWDRYGTGNGVKLDSAIDAFKKKKAKKNKRKKFNNKYNRAMRRGEEREQQRGQNEEEQTEVEANAQVGETDKGKGKAIIDTEEQDRDPLVVRSEY
jgi:hypothetical protein